MKFPACSDKITTPRLFLRKKTRIVKQKVYRTRAVETSRLPQNHNAQGRKNGRHENLTKNMMGLLLCICIFYFWETKEWTSWTTSISEETKSTIPKFSEWNYQAYSVASSNLSRISQVFYTFLLLVLHFLTKVAIFSYNHLS